MCNWSHWMVIPLKGCTTLPTQSTRPLSSLSPRVFPPDPTLSPTSSTLPSLCGLSLCVPFPGCQQGQQRVSISQEAENGASGMQQLLLASLWGHLHCLQLVHLHTIRLTVTPTHHTPTSLWLTCLTSSCLSLRLAWTAASVR